MLNKTLLGSLLALASLAPLGGCGKKPQARPQVATTPAAPVAPDRGPTGPGAEPDQTSGGVPLAGAPANVAHAAIALARRPDSATRQLIAAGEAARPMARALLASLNLQELEGALDYFAAVPDDGALGSIAPLLAHDAATVRDAARRALAGHRGSLLAQAVAPLTESPKAAVRIDAVRTLAGIGGLLARAALVLRLDDADDTVVLEAGSALSRLGPPVDQAALDALFAREDARPAQLRAALTIAGRAGGVVPPAVVDKALTANDEVLATVAARAVAAVPAGERAPLVERTSKDPRDAVRRGLLEGVSASDDPTLRATAERLAREAVTSGSVELRVAAASALAALLPESARKAARTTPAAPDAPPAPTDTASAPKDEAGPPPAAVVPAPPAGFDPATFGPLPALLLGLLDDPAPPVRRAAGVLLARDLPGPITATALDARVTREDDAVTQQILLSALTRIGTRDAFARVIARLEAEPIGKLAHIALIRAAGQEIPREVAAWTAWLNARFGAPRAATDGPGAAAPEGDTAVDAAPGAPAPTEVVPLPDGTLPAHIGPDGNWIPRKPPPLPPGYKKPDTPRPLVTGAPG